MAATKMKNWVTATSPSLMMPTSNASRKMRPHDPLASSMLRRIAARAFIFSTTQAGIASE